jgi:hypothetical protein
MRQARHEVTEHTVNALIELVRSATRKYSVYTSMFGINDELSLPTITIVVPSLWAPRMKDVIDRIQILYPSYDYDAFMIRFTRGQVTPAGRIFHYPRVPIGSSISPDESYDSTPTARTLASIALFQGVKDCMRSPQVTAFDPLIRQNM